MKKLQRFISEHWLFLFLLSILSFIFISTLSKTLLWDWDECLYAGYAHAMKESGNFLTNYWNGQVILDKIPLYTVLLQLPLFFSNSDVGMRLINVIFSILLLIAVYNFCISRFTKRVAIFSVMLFLTCEVAVRYLTKISTDIPYALFIFLGYAVFTSQLPALRRGLIAGVLLGLAVLVKGFGVLPFLMVFCFISIFYEPNRYKQLISYLLGGFIFTTVPWLYIQYALYGQKFITVYFLENIIQRARYPIEIHFGGKLFYVKHLFRELFPWIMSGFVWVIIAFGNIKSSLKKDKEIIGLLLCVVMPFISLTLAKTKIEWYLIPLYPFLVIYIAKCLDILFLRFKVSNIVIILVGLLILVDGLHLITTETNFFEKQIAISPRNKIALESRKDPSKTLNYLVQFSERRAREVLNPTLYTSFTWIYGGNACAYYYSGKKINYHYSAEDFVTALKRGNGLYLVENGDLHFVSDFPIRVVSKNSDFTLFRVD